MNAATRAQVLRLVTRTIEKGGPSWPERVRLIFRAGNSRDRQRIPAGRWPAMEPFEPALQPHADPSVRWDLEPFNVDQEEPDRPTAEEQGFKIEFLH